jgi:conserved hypothetical protein
MLSRIRPYTKHIAILITIILVALLFTQVSLKVVLTTLLQSNPVYLLAGFILYLSSYLFRSWRFHILLNNEVGIKDLFHIECVHNMMNNLLPARTGELSYIYLLKKNNCRTTGDGLATLVVARIFDFIIISALFLSALFLYHDISSGLMKYLWLVFLFFVIMLVLILALIFSGNWTQSVIKNFCIKIHIGDTSVGQLLLQKSEETIQCVSRIFGNKMSFIPVFMRCLILTAFIWASLYLMIFVLMYAMGFTLSFPLVLLGSTFAIFSTVLPIQGIGGFGTTESAWVIGFVILGVSGDIAINSGFGYHILVLIFTVILGGFGFFILRKKV